MQEQILLKKQFITGTTISFFDTKIEDSGGNTLYPSYVTLNAYNVPQAIFTFDGQALWSLDSRNINIPLSSVTSNFITGKTFFQTTNHKLSTEERQKIQTNFFSTMNLTSSGLSTSFVFFEDKQIDDLFINLSISRTYETLDTLNIYNNTINSFPTQEAKTGVLFGKLEAIQKLKDVNGKNIRIPLANVPVGIFNPSDTFPTSTSVDENGDRITLNFSEFSSKNEYINLESFSSDTQNYLRAGSQFTTVPDQFKFITKTNENGEYIIYNAPIGSQIVVFEVDLFKQGLTKDEIALNFFPFPTESDANIDNIPSFFFRQIPVDIVPAWGDIQTGYTELNVSANLDLRKWATYFFPPVSIAAQKLETLIAQNAVNSLKIKIRDMTKNSISQNDLKVVEIPNDLNRIDNQQFFWQNEFAQSKKQAEFFTFGFSIVKLPSNIYDPFSFSTDKNGIPTNKKGLWLAAYQFKLFSSDEKNINRKTGLTRYISNGQDLTLSHFDLNYTIPNIGIQDAPASLGVFPYEKPWSVDYPERYSIPQKPTEFVTPIFTAPSGELFLEQPLYSDGDLIGNFPPIVQSSGYGTQPAFNVWIDNRFSGVLTKNEVYRYESGVTQDEIYANGFSPLDVNDKFFGKSSVIGGEKYQRVEAGYGYFMRPEGWPRAIRYPGIGEALFGPDIEAGSSKGLNTYGDSNNPGPGITPANISINGLFSEKSHKNDIYNLDNQNVALSLDTRVNIKQGGIDIYRIVDSGPSNLVNPQKFILPTFTRYNLGSFAECYRLQLYNSGEIDIEFTLVTSRFSIKISLAVNEFKTLRNLGSNDPNISLILDTEWIAITLPGNSSFDPLTNKYTKTKYEFSYGISNGHYGVQDLPSYLNADPFPNIPEYWLASDVTGASGGVLCEGLWFCPRTKPPGGNNGGEIWSLHWSATYPLT